MRGGDFCTAAAVDEFEASYRAALVVGGEHGGAEDAVADNTRGQAFSADACLFEAEWTLVVADGGRQRRDGIANARKGAFVITKAKIDDANEVLRAERSYCRLRVGETAFDKLAVDCSRDVVREIEIGVGFDECEKMARARGIGNDLLDPGDGVKSSAASLYRLIIDRPIALELAGTL